MNVLENFEAVFVVVAGLACAATYAIDNAAMSPVEPNMQVVVVSAKRMTAEEKLQSLQAERAIAVADNANKAASKL
ncbi:hypothetical protein [Duganella callida]|uniref:Uncharacterized protein n=1 Tax=Duganella callida TaxID=2561932 RepID=A0A4Y9RX16_9BURK|nr:hypothetical protein [Duganella callida]TFW13817.1 hypothetical protein E4L98_28145 [Duganella callida]